MIRFETVLANCSANIVVALICTVDASRARANQKIVDVIAVNGFGSTNCSLDFIAVLGIHTPTHESVV
jgi:hypothetical protein